MRLEENEREFLENPFVGILTEHRPDGSLHTTPVWVDADGRAEAVPEPGSQASSG